MTPLTPECGQVKCSDGHREGFKRSYCRGNQVDFLLDGALGASEFVLYFCRDAWC